jgi:tetratricopeptide (TPR) repeat protein
MTAVLLAALVALAHLPQVGQSIPVAIPKPSQPASANFLPQHKFNLENVLATLRQYHEAVLLYRRGATADAMAAVGQLPRAELEFVIDTLRGTANTPLMRQEVDVLPFRWTRDDLAAAGMLHGDITLAASGGTEFEPSLRLTLSVLPIADRARPDTADASGTWTRDWLRAVGGVLLANNRLTDLETVLAYVKILFPDDGPLLLVRGTVRELQSEAPVEPIMVTFAEGLARARLQREDLQQESIDALTRAHQLMPASSETAVRLAHVRSDMRQDSRAIPLLDEVLARPQDRWWYLAALLRGAVYERQRDERGAERLYRSLIDRFPQAQAPWLALAMLQSAGGRDAESAATLDRMYAHVDVERGDPWWETATSMGPDASAALEALRLAVRQ